MDEIKYASIIIPTLNRFVHFKRCLESIERCTGADKTDVYIGLDYPPTEKYVDGWKKIDNYLVNKEKNNGFNKLIVYRRVYNCGVSGKKSNKNLLIESVRLFSDRIIFSEDDNEFSPNFLDYMNKSLEFYKDDPKVLYVSAYTNPIFKGITNSTTFFSIDTPAYGVGMWVYKDAAESYTNEKLSNDLCKSLKRTFRLYRTFPAIVGMSLSMIQKNAQWGDVRRSMYNLIYHTFTLLPAESLCRNWGCDGSGLHSGFVVGLEKEEIQGASTFNLQDIKREYLPAMLNKISFLNMPTSFLRRKKILITTFIRVLQLYFLKKIYL